MKEHLSKVLETMSASGLRHAESSIAKAKHYGTLAKCYEKLAAAASESSDEDGAENYREMAESFQKLAAAHITSGEGAAADARAFQSVSKALNTPDPVSSDPGYKREGLNWDPRDPRKMMDAAELAKVLIPDTVRGMIPSNVPSTAYGVTAIPRVGQPTELVNSRDVPAEFERFIKVETE